MKILNFCTKSFFYLYFKTLLYNVRNKIEVIGKIFIIIEEKSRTWI